MIKNDVRADLEAMEPSNQLLNLYNIFTLAKIMIIKTEK